MIWQTVLLILFIVLSSFFSLSETALTAISRFKIKKLLSQNVFGAKDLHYLRENPGKMLTTLLIGNNIVNIGAASLATFMVLSFFERLSISNSGIEVTATSILMTVVLLVFGEISPKTIAIKHADRLALLVAPVIHFLEIVLTPVITVLNYMCRPLIKIFGGDMKVHVPFVTEDELKMLLSVSEEEGILEQEENKMIHSIFEFGDTVAKEVMVPRPDMFCLDVNTAQDMAARKIAEEGHSRIPVYEGATDNIIGIILMKDLLKLLVENRDMSIRDIIHPPLFVPESKKLDDLMRQMQLTRTHIAIVVDEYGGVAGLVSLEDLLEEIVGEIKDEFDTEEKDVDAQSDGTMLVDGRLSIKDANEKIGSNIPEGDYDTIGGFVLSLSGRLPMVGDTVVYGNLKISVEKVFKRRITRLKISAAG